MTADVADVLDKAANVIERRGWNQGALGVGVGPVCVVGAIRVAAVGDVNAAGSARVQAARRALGQWLGDDYDSGPSLPDWNDEPGRTADQVIAALRAAAAAERAS